MGRFHCIKSDCASVWVKKPGETKTEVLLGDLRVNNNYQNTAQTIDDVTGYELVETGRYCLVEIDKYDPYYINVVNAEFSVSGEDSQTFNYQDFKFLSTPTIKAKRLMAGWPQPGSRLRTQVSIFYAQDENPQNPCDWIRLDPREYGGSTPYWNFNYTAVNHQSEYEKCSLEVYRNADIIYQAEISYRETSYRAYRFDQRNCFDIEWRNIKDSRLITTKDKWQVYKVEKLPYLERLEVVPFAYQNFGFSLYQADIPDECLNIYLNDSTIFRSSSRYKYFTASIRHN